MRPATAAAALALVAGALFVSPAKAAGGGEAPDFDFSFEGPFGRFDQAQLQRGWQVYSEVCAACHGIKHLYYRNLGDHGGPEFSKEQVKAIAEAFTVVDGPDSEGDMFDRPAKPADAIVSPFANDEAAAAANGGALPPDLSLIAKSRTGFHGTFKQLVSGSGGPEYLYALLTGYEDPPPRDVDVGDLYYNRAFAGNAIAMAPPLFDDLIEYQDGSPATVGQMAEDVTAFLAWAAEPKMMERKSAGLRNIVILVLLASLLYAANRRLWKPVKHDS